MKKTELIKALNNISQDLEVAIDWDKDIHNDVTVKGVEIEEGIIYIMNYKPKGRKK